MYATWLIHMRNLFTLLVLLHRDFPLMSFDVLKSLMLVWCSRYKREVVETANRTSREKCVIECNVKCLGELIVNALERGN